MSVIDERSGAAAFGVASYIAVFVDMDAVLLDAHQGRRGMEINVQGDIAEGLKRLAQVSDRIVVLAFPKQSESRRDPSTESRIDVLRDGLDGAADGVEIVTCPHAGGECECAKPGVGLIKVAQAKVSGDDHKGWFIGADQQGVQSGRQAGLRTVRVGPAGADHMSSVHKPDYEARDLLDAANHILIEELA
jgi:histidinol phosphatase-like enzyme